MKKILFPVVGVLSLVMTLTACQKVINLDLRTAPAKYVIEANVTDLPGPYQVKISQTGAVDSNYSFKGISQATVSITDNAGNGETLREVQPGVFQTVTLQGVEGRRYQLTITIGGNSYTASSTMPYRVNMDSLYTQKEFYFSKSVIAAVPLFTDPAGRRNDYLFNQTINGNQDRTVYIQNDDFVDGKIINAPLLRPSPDSTLHSGDRVDVEMQCIDSANYNYWYTASLASLGNGGNSVPANPVTNIQGGALGYFSAHTSQTKTIFVK